MSLDLERTRELLELELRRARTTLRRGELEVELARLEGEPTERLNHRQGTLADFRRKLEKAELVIRG